MDEWKVLTFRGAESKRMDKKPPVITKTRGNTVRQKHMRVKEQHSGNS